MKAMAAPGIFTRLAGIILLAVFGAGQLPVVSLLTAAVAVVDGGHEVDLTGIRDGVRLVLHHDRGAVSDMVSRPASHHHRGLMRFIAGEDGGESHPDHELLFRSAGLLAKETEKQPLTALCAELMDSVEIPGAVRIPERCLDRTPAHGSALPQYWWPPSPAECTWGSVVLLV